MELFLHYSLIPSVSKGMERPRRVGKRSWVASMYRLPRGPNRSAERHQLDFLDLLSYIMHQKHRQKTAFNGHIARDNGF